MADQKPKSSLGIFKNRRRSWLGRLLHKLAKPAAVLGIIGAFATFVAAYAEKVRVGHLEIVSKQLEKLYGPVYAVAQANETTWDQFRDQYMPSRKFFPVWGYHKPDPQKVNVTLSILAGTRYAESETTELTFRRSGAARDELSRWGASVFTMPGRPEPSEVTEWRTWMKTVFQPLNVRMEQAIVGNLHLVIGRSLPPSFLKLVSHTEGYKAVIAAWKDSDATAEGYTDSKKNVSLANFPDDVLLCAKDSFELLKARQVDLLLSPLAAFAGPLPPPCSCEPDTTDKIAWTDATTIGFWSVMGRVVWGMVTRLVGISHDPSRVQCALSQNEAAMPYARKR